MQPEVGFKSKCQLKQAQAVKGIVYPACMLIAEVHASDRLSWCPGSSRVCLHDTVAGLMSQA